MKAIARYVVVVVLGVMFFPAVSLAKSGPTPGTEVESVPFGPRPHRSEAPAAPAAAPAAVAGSTAALAAREQRSRALQDFRGGGVYVYLGSGALAVMVVVLLILLI